MREQTEDRQHIYTKSLDGVSKANPPSLEKYDLAFAPSSLHTIAGLFPSHITNSKVSLALCLTLVI